MVARMAPAPASYASFRRLRADLVAPKHAGWDNGIRALTLRPALRESGRSPSVRSSLAKNCYLVLLACACNVLHMLGSGRRARVQKSVEVPMRCRLTSLLTAILLVAGCAGITGNRPVVAGAGDELLKLRAGPGLGYRVLIGLPDGTALTRHDCVTEVGQLWCRVSLLEAPRMTGYVSADYLSDS